MISVAMEPSPRPLNHSSLQLEASERRFWSTSWFQVSAHSFEPLSEKSMFTVVPSTLNGWPPACQIIEVAKPGSPVSFVIFLVGSAAVSFFAVSMYSSQVVGTVRPYWSNTALL